MIINKKSFQIKKIAETQDNWLLYPKGADKPLELPKNLVYGKLPPVWKFPWQCHTLNTKSVAGFAVYAEMDGLVLFDIPEDSYPQEVKDEITRIRNIEAEYTKMQKEYQDSIRAQLTEYLPLVPQVKELEDRISELPICWRPYLKMLLPMQYQNDDSLQRLTLLYWLITIADRLYKRHVNTKEIGHIIWAKVHFTTCHRAVFDLTDILVDEIENNPEHRNSRIFSIYFEVRDELRRVLPQAPQRLEIYFIQTICCLLKDYATDMSLLSRWRSQHCLESDSQTYRFIKKEMKLPKFKSLIIENEFSYAEIEQYNSAL